MIDWKQKLKNQWVQIEISRVQPGKPGNFLPLGPFPFQYSSEGSAKAKTRGAAGPKGVLGSPLNIIPGLDSKYW